jgi:hypothetical protein
MTKMTKTEFKKMLKPLIKECIRESIFEDGVLSGIITEVANGMKTTDSPSTTPVAAADPTLQRMQRNAFKESQNPALQQGKAKLMAAIGGNTFNGVDLFEGTTPAPAAQSLAEQASPLSDQHPSDAGVDITNLLGAVGRNWNAHMNEVKEGK